MYVGHVPVGLFSFPLAHWLHSVTLVFLSCYPGGNRNLGTWQLLQRSISTLTGLANEALSPHLCRSLQDLSYSPVPWTSIKCQLYWNGSHIQLPPSTHPLPNPLMIINLLRSSFLLLPGKEHSGRSESLCFLLQFSWKESPWFLC